MALRYYDDILVAKLKKWIPDNSKLRILKPDESKRLFETQADDNKDQPIKLPLIALSRNNDIELLSNVKSQKSFSGQIIGQTEDVSVLFNVLPIKLDYQLDIYTKTTDEGDEYLRTFLFKLINNPLIKVQIPYNDSHIEHTANIRVGNQVSDTSSIAERIFSGQFTRWTIQLEIQDAMLFSIPYKRNWKIVTDDGLLEDVISGSETNTNADFKEISELQIADNLTDEPIETELLNVKIIKA